MIAQQALYWISLILNEIIYFSYFLKNYKLIAINLSKQQALDADAKAIQGINFTGNLEQNATTKCFIIEKAKETILDFLQETVKSTVILE